MDSRADRPAATRLFLLTGGALVWAVLIVFRLFQLQIINHRSYREQAESQQLRDLELLAQRGVVFDRSGRPLAMSVQADSVFINPRLLPDRAVAAELLSPILSLDRRELFDKIQWAFQHRRGFFWVKRKVTPAESARLKSLGLEWINFRPETQRHYPKGLLAAHVVGAVDHQQRGNLGLEQSLDRELRGRDGVVRVLSDVRQRAVDSKVSAEPQAGTNIYLTIDERIQYVAERELKLAAEKEHCNTGSVVVLKPNTGEILAMASYPAFDPNRPPAPGEDLSDRFNQAISVPFEPGSVFKVITLTAALETTNLKPDTIINCGGGVKNVFGRIVHDHHAYSALPFADVLAKSSNIGAIEIGMKVGEARLLEYIRRFGFGRSVGIPLPAESGGMVRDLRFWQKTSIGSVPMGHEISTTTLQLAQATAVIANGGKLVKPSLVLARQRPGGPIEKAPAPQPVQVIKGETSNTMRKLMEGVVLNGTGKGARLDGYTAGGKTGTAQIFDFASRSYTHKYNSSFMGFAPVASPAIVVVVTLNGSSKYGGTIAAPVFRAVAGEALRLLDVPKDLPEGLLQAETNPEEQNDVAIAGLGSPPPPALPPESSTAATVDPDTVVLLGPRVPSFQGKSMRAVLRESLAMGLPVDVIGSGIARDQAPSAGAVLPPGERVRVLFAP